MVLRVARLVPCTERVKRYVADVAEVEEVVRGVYFVELDVDSYLNREETVSGCTGKKCEA